MLQNYFLLILTAARWLLLLILVLFLFLLLLAFSWAARIVDITSVAVYSQLTCKIAKIQNIYSNVHNNAYWITNCLCTTKTRTIISIQVSRIGIENTVDMNSPLLSICWRENSRECFVANSFIFSDINTANTGNSEWEKEREREKNKEQREIYM